MLPPYAGCDQWAIMIGGSAVAGSLPASKLSVQRGGVEAGCGPGRWMFRVVLHGAACADATAGTGSALPGGDVLQACNRLAFMNVTQTIATLSATRLVPSFLVMAVLTTPTDHPE